MEENKQIIDLDILPIEGNESIIIQGTNGVTGRVILNTLSEYILGTDGTSGDDFMPIIDNPIESQHLVFDGTNWINKYITIGLSNLSDISIINPENEQQLVFNGTNWVNKTISNEISKIEYNAINGTNSFIVDENIIISNTNGNSMRYSVNSESNVSWANDDNNIPSIGLIKQNISINTKSFVSTDYTLNSNDSIILIDTENVIIILPEFPIDGRVYTIKDITNSATPNIVIFVFDSTFHLEGSIFVGIEGETIDGSSLNSVRRYLYNEFNKTYYKI